MAVITSTSGCAPLVRRRGPLLHPEAVLLVHHHQAQPVELDALLDQRVGPDDDLRPPVGDTGAGPLPLTRLERSR